MPKVVGVRFKRAGKVYYFDPGEWEINRGEAVVVETARGLELGNAVVQVREVPEEEVVQPLKKVIRKASEEDVRRSDENEARAKRAFSVGQQKIVEHGLPMKLVDVEYTFDNSKIIFYFTAEGRVDFRELVKDLAGVFRTRIELRQIGVRDEAKMLGGLGPCGRGLCCRTFLGDFEPVSIRMAKDQNLSLNPTKISGICGRLMCCLKYESESYRAAKVAAKQEQLAAGAAPDAVGQPAAEVMTGAEALGVNEGEGCPACPGCAGGCPAAVEAEQAQIQTPAQSQGQTQAQAQAPGKRRSHGQGRPQNRTPRQGRVQAPGQTQGQTEGQAPGQVTGQTSGQTPSQTPGQEEAQAQTAAPKRRRRNRKRRRPSAAAGAAQSTPTAPTEGGE